MSREHHVGLQPALVNVVEAESDSAATTLLASASSSKEHSFDRAQRYADIESEKWDRTPIRDHVDDEGDAPREDHHLLADETRALNASARAAATIPDDDEPPPPPPPPVAQAGVKAKPISWSSLPKKSQLAILTMARLSEPLTQTSLQSYMFYQLKSFTGPDGLVPSDSTVARQAGLLAAGFTGAQFLTAMMWGRLADSERFGRKRVILIGLLGTMIGSLGFGFSESFAVALFWRAAGGSLNGNVGVMRTMISEIVKDKKYLSRAFLLLPMTFNIGVIIGPLLGGLLADPVGSYPSIFGPGGSVGGKDGVLLFQRWPYALPNLVMATFLCCSALGVTFGLEETLEGLRDKPDFGLTISRWVGRNILRRRPSRDYTTLAGHEHSGDVEMAPLKNKTKPQARGKLPFRRIWTANVLTTLLSHALLAMHVGTFSNLWFVFLSTPRYAHSLSDAVEDRDTTTINGTTVHLPPHYRPHAPFTFTGGLALPPPSIGTALSILGVIGISMQLLLYPRVSFRLGTTNSYRWSLLLFPVAYFLAPFLAVIPSTVAAPGQASGVLVWAGITVVLAVQVLARTFALPSAAILVNNASPHPSVLGTLHGMAQSCSSGARSLGPVLAGWIYGVGLNHGVVGTAWWCMCGVAFVGAMAGRWVKEGDGHEIWLPEDGEREEGKT